MTIGNFLCEITFFATYDLEMLLCTKKMLASPMYNISFMFWFNFKLNFIFIKLKIGKKHSEISMGIRLSIGESAKFLPVSPFKLFQLISKMTKFQTQIEN